MERARVLCILKHKHLFDYSLSGLIKHKTQAIRHGAVGYNKIDNERNKCDNKW